MYFKKEKYLFLKTNKEANAIRVYSQGRVMFTCVE